MSRARPQTHVEWQTAAANENGSGCLSVSLLTPLAVLVIAGFLTLLALNTPTPTAALLVNRPTPLAQTNNLNPPGQMPPAGLFSTGNSTSANGLSPIFTEEVQHWANDIVRWASAASVDPNLAAVVMQIESCGDPRALSR